MPENWKTYKLREIGVVITGKTPSSNTPNHFGNFIPFITPTDFSNYHKHVTVSDRSLSETGMAALSNKVLPAKSLLVTCIGSQMGKVVVNNEPVITNQQLNSIIVNELADIDYLHYKLVSISEKLRTIAGGGSTMPMLNKTDFENIEISIPPLQEQKSIASILSALDDKIELNLQMNKTLEEMAMALYKHWFVDFGPFQNGKFVASELGMIPEGWEVLKVKDYGDVTTGKTPSKNFPEHFGNFVPFVTPTGFSNYGMHITESDRMISQIGYDKHNRSVIPVNSVIVTCIGSDMGKVSISKVECLTNQQINSLKCESYLFMYFFFVNSYKLLKRLAGDGTTMPIINKSTFENMEVVSPPESIILEFQDMVGEFDNQIESNTLENQTLTTLRDTLLPKLISGEIRVKDAEKLLATSL